MSTDQASPVSLKLVQTTLTSAFTASSLSRTSPTTTTSPYFTKPAPAAPSHPPSTAPTSSNPTAHLTPSRRANLHPASPAPLPRTPNPKRSAHLALTAHLTKTLLPPLLARLPSAPPTGHLLTPSTLPALPPHYSPNLPLTPIRVLNTDTLDAALALSPPSSSSSPSTAAPTPVLILNMANAHHPTGGFAAGALAQEESLCYRSSLSFTLKRRFYPLPVRGLVYSPTVVVVRESLSRGHGVLEAVAGAPETLPVVSVVSVAAVRGPRVVLVGDGEENGGGGERYEDPADRELMKEKMRGVLRCAGGRGHRRVVLGALGCGAFANPRGEVVECWREVFAEEEFAGGWWETVIFAVLEEGGRREGEGNFGAFWRGLDGVLV